MQKERPDLISLRRPLAVRTKAETYGRAARSELER